MASVSFSMTAAAAGTIGGPSTVTAGTSAPGAGAIEVRVDNAVGLRKNEVLLALQRIADAIDADTSLVT